MTEPQLALSGETLRAQALALKLLGMALYLRPTEPFLAHLRQDDLLTEWPLLPADPNGSRAVQTILADLRSAPLSDLLPSLNSDYTALFVGLERVAAPPWESVYLSRDHLLFDEQTLRVRETYARFGLQIPRIDREPDDHIGFELLFLSHLAELAAQALDAGDPASAVDYLAAGRDFLIRHPQRWAHLFAERVERSAATGYYRGLAQLLLCSLDSLAALLNETLPPAAS